MTFKLLSDSVTPFTQCNTAFKLLHLQPDYKNNKLEAMKDIIKKVIEGEFVDPFHFHNKKVKNHVMKSEELTRVATFVKYFKALKILNLFTYSSISVQYDTTHTVPALKIDGNNVQLDNTFIILKCFNKNYQLVKLIAIDFNNEYKKRDLLNNDNLMIRAYDLLDLKSDNVKLEFIEYNSSRLNDEENKRLIRYDDTKVKLNRVTNALKSIRENPDKFSVGEWCERCFKNSTCSFYKESSKKALSEKMNEADLKTLANTILFNPLKISNEDLSFFMSDFLILKDAYIAALEISKKRILDDESIPGFYLSERKGATTWAIEPDEVEKLLKNRRLKKADIYNNKLITPNQAVNLLQLEGVKLETFKQNFKVSSSTYTVTKAQPKTQD